ncbi:type 4a pilus biogenesis protein PilO [Jidongwangia harbinensis]|uniref:type 4a pilus biogenesis protein PilO n=1 Tax=Jidongwangia harbinensis TaxID=2878561 RepID=UPI001CD938F9|nr:type 4a pilus biogenesis protein PilO [Jidongwangia harbinensis]MCA2215348.1 type 4a pilus biogenesis protein PilO [Jidongwangia harbinensis]
MRITADRLWMIGGAVVVALLVALTGLILVADQRSQADGFDEQRESAHTQAAQLRTRTAKLKADQDRIGELTAERDMLKAALPAGPAVPAFLRQLQATGTAVGVDVSGITVGDPVEEEKVKDVWSLPIQLTASGTATQMGQFLDQLQGSGQKRAVLIETVNAETGADPQRLTLALTVKAFVAPPAGAGAPTVTTN